MRALWLGVLFYAGVLAMDIWPVEPLNYRIAQYVPNDITARLDFKVPSQERMDEASRRAETMTPATFTLDRALYEKLALELKGLPETLRSCATPATMPEELRKTFALTDSESLTPWRATSQPERRSQYASQTDRLLKDLLRLPLIAQDDKNSQAKRRATQVRLGEEIRPASELIGLEEPNLTQSEISRMVTLRVEPLYRHSLQSFLIGTFTRRPLWRYDGNATQKDIQDAIATVLADPPTDDYPAGSVLVPRSVTLGREMQPLFGPRIRLLMEEHRQYLQQEQKLHPWRPWLRLAGRAAVLLLATFLMTVYIARYQPQVVNSRLRAVSVVVVLLVMLAITKIISLLIFVSPYAAVGPVVVAAIIMAIAYDQRFGLAMGGILSLFVVFQLRGDMSMLLVLVAAVSITVAQLREIRTRLKLIGASFATAAGVMGSIWALNLSSGVPFWPFSVKEGLWGAGAALLAGFLVHGLLPVIERLFRVATSMTLLEWCDASKPLLRRLATEAPGTHNHSLQLGSICEAAAEAIGARGLLARVGAYYHDIGKINKPDYFVENEFQNPSRHARLSPAMSLLVITGHVKDGLEMAREYGLPRLLHEFIATHHGTTLVQFFYQAAAESRKSDSDRLPDEVEFRYPGPKPRSKEAAILMLADAAESSVRAMPEPTPGRIETQVHTIVNRRLMDGQLGDCDLTLREVYRIEESLIKSLNAMTHSRIAYPAPAGQRPSPSETPTKKENGNGHGANGKTNGKDGPAQGPADLGKEPSDVVAPASGDLLDGPVDAGH